MPDEEEGNEARSEAEWRFGRAINCLIPDPDDGDDPDDMESVDLDAALVEAEFPTGGPTIDGRDMQPGQRSCRRWSAME